jgi:hypothetical protein
VLLSKVSLSNYKTSNLRHIKVNFIQLTVLVLSWDQAKLGVKLIASASMLNNAAKDFPYFISKAKGFRNKESNNSSLGKDLISRNSIAYNYLWYINTVLVCNMLLNLSKNKVILLLRFVCIKRLVLLISRFILAMWFLRKKALT